MTSPEYMELLTRHNELDEQSVRADAQVAKAIQNVEAAIRCQIDVQNARLQSVAALAAQRQIDDLKVDQP